MPDHNRHSDNLFLRLFPYTLREGRRPLEDYCTELLAWCLRSSQLLQREFLGLLNLPGIRSEDKLHIDTQQSYIDEDGLDDDLPIPRGRFDLMIRPATENGYLIVIESKVDSPLYASQLARYKDHLQTKALRRQFKHRHLVTLTKKPHRSKNAVNLTWLRMQQILEKVGGEETSTFVLSQFADFLKENGMAPMKLHPIDQSLVKSLPDYYALMRDLENLLKTFRTHEALIALGLKVPRRPKNESDNPRSCVWLGVHGTNRGYFYSGFMLSCDPKKPGILAWIEIELEGDQRKLVQRYTSARITARRCAQGWRRHWFEKGYKEALDEFLESERKSYLYFATSLEGSYSGNPKKVLEWFISTLTGALKICGKTFSK